MLRTVAATDLRVDPIGIYYYMTGEERRLACITIEYRADGELFYRAVAFWRDNRWQITVFEKHEDHPVFEVVDIRMELEKFNVWQTVATREGN